MKAVRASRYWLLVWIICCMGQVLSNPAWAAANRIIVLNQGWQFRQSTNLEGVANAVLAQQPQRRLRGDESQELLGSGRWG